MRSTSTPIRCKRCNVQLASHDPDGLCIRRGNLQATVTGSDFTVSVCCYRCKTLNILTAAPQPDRHVPRRAGATVA